VKGLPVVHDPAAQAQLSDRNHEHHHGAGHVHAPASFGRAFAIGIGLNVAFVAVEFVFGVLANSVSLLADAGHNLSDVLGLVIAWIASVLVRRPPSSRYTYGLRSSSILAALFNAVFLLVAVGAIAWEAILRLLHPEPVASGVVMIVATVGIVINGATAWLFASGRKGDLNIRGAFMHMGTSNNVRGHKFGLGPIFDCLAGFFFRPLLRLEYCRRLHRLHAAASRSSVTKRRML